MKQNISKLKRTVEMLSIAKEKIETASHILPGFEEEWTIGVHVDIEDAQSAVTSCMKAIEDRIENEK